MKMRTLSALGTAVSVVLVTAAPVHGGVIVVDKAGGAGAQFTSIPDGVAAASDGDVVVVRAGNYGFDVWTTIDNRDVTIVADGVVDYGQFYSAFIVQNLTANKHVVIRGFELSGGGLSATSPTAIRLVNNAGRVWLDSCTLKGAPAISATNCSDVVITNCTVVGGTTVPEVTTYWTVTPYPALRAIDSNTFVYSSTLTGSGGTIGACYPSGYQGANPGQPGAAVDGGSALFAGCTLTGGHGANGAQCTNYCQPATSGGSAVDLLANNPTVRLAGDTVFPGASGIPVGTCPPPPTAPAIHVGSGTAISLPAIPGVLEAPSPLREGQASSLSISHAGGDIALLFVAATPGSILLPQYGGALELGTQIVGTALGSIPAAGILSVPFVVPNLPPSLLGLTVFAQAAACGATCALTNPAALTVLDSSL